MAAAIVPVSSGRHGKDISAVGDLFVGLFEITFSGSYPAGGEDLLTTLAQYFKGKGAGIVFTVNVAGEKAGYTFDYNGTTGKLIVRQGDNTNAAAAPAIELPAAGYPAALTGLAGDNKLRVVVFGL